MTYRARPLLLEDVLAGHWYFGFECLVCDLLFAVLEDESDGRRRFNFGGDGYVQALCPHCSVDCLYTADQLMQYQAQ
jgi:hypothetical protein